MLAVRRSPSSTAVLDLSPDVRDHWLVGSKSAELDQPVAVKPEELDPLVKPFWGTRELHRVGLGHQRAVLAAIKDGSIPAVRIGRRFLIPTSWIRRTIGLDDTS